MKMLLIAIALLWPLQARALPGKAAPEQGTGASDPSSAAIAFPAQSGVQCVCTAWDIHANCSHWDCRPTAAAAAPQGSAPRQNTLSAARPSEERAPTALTELLQAAGPAEEPVVAANNPNCHLVCVAWNSLGYCVNYTPVCP